MNTYHDSFERDDLTRRIVQKAGAEEPSFNFTSSVMQKILAGSALPLSIYKPVISKKAWIVICLILVAGSLLFSFSTSSPAPAENIFTRYLTPAENVLNSSSSGILEKLSSLNSFSWIAAAFVAGWVLLGADKLLRKVEMAD
jgi:hypothetical protein